MGEHDGNTLAGLVEGLEALTRRLGNLESENERVRQENVRLHRKLADLAGSATDGATPGAAVSRGPAVAAGARVSRRALLGRAGAAALAAAAGGILLTPREARAATVSGEGTIGVRGLSTKNGSSGVEGYANFEGTGYGVRGYGGGQGYAGVYGSNGDASGYGVFGQAEGNGGQGVVGRGRSASGYGVRGENPAGYGVRGGSDGAGFAGVVGYGDNGVEGVGERNGWSGVYGRHDEASVGPGVTGDGKGNWPGVWGRNPAADGVLGETNGKGYSGVYGRHNGATGYGVTGIGKGAAGFGVVGKNFDSGGTGVLGESTTGVTGTGTGTGGYGGQFGGGKAQLRILPGAKAGKPTTGAHARGEIFMDSAATLWVCTKEGSPGTWRQVNTS